MPSACQLITCVKGCSNALPEVEFDICNPDFHFGQISDLFIANLGHPLSDETNQQEWINRMSALGDPSGQSKILRLLVIGDKPAAEGAEIEASYGRTAYAPKVHTINFRIDEVSDKNYEFMRHHECNRTVLMWYKTKPGKLYGGATGIKASIQLNHVIPESAGELEILTGVLKWRSKFHPCRGFWPLQEEDEASPGEYVNM